MYFNIKCIGKLSGPTKEFERSQVFETGEFERPKFDCIYMYEVTKCPKGHELIHVNWENAYMYLQFYSIQKTYSTILNYNGI